MSAKLVLFCALVAALSLPAAASAQEEPPQINWEAALYAPDLPTKDPCVFDLVVIDVLDFIDPTRPDTFGGNIWRRDVCTGVTIFLLGLLESPALAEDGFVVSHDGDRGEFEVVLPLWEQETQRFTETSLSLRWDLRHGPGRGEAQVTGKIRFADITIHLKPSFEWNRWGSETFPWAGFWFCDFSRGGPGCIGQT